MNAETQMQQAVVRILNQKLRINKNLLTPEYFTSPLTGGVFRLSGADLIYLILEIEKEFGMKFCAEDVVEHRFNTIEGIASSLNRWVQSQVKVV